MSTEAAWDLVANLVCTRVVVQVVQVGRANPAGQILIVLRWVDYPVLREVAGLGENQAKWEVEVKMASLVRQTVLST